MALSTQQRLDIAHKGGYSQESIKATIKDDYFETLAKNGNRVSVTLSELAVRYSRSESGIKHIVYYSG